MFKIFRIFTNNNILLILLFFFNNISVAHIITTNNFATIKNNIATANLNTLVIFDIDEVLLQPQDQILNIKNSTQLQNMFYSIRPKLTAPQIQELDSLIMLQRQVEPVDSRFIDLIKKLQTKQIRVLALTQCSTGSLGKVPNLENWRIKELKKLGYHFDKSWQDIKTKYFNTLKSTVDLKRTPAFKQGIIFSCGVPKGDTLKAFLDYINLVPKNIIFIDDKIKNIASIEQFTKQNNIAFLGIHYTKAATSKLPILNHDIVKLQLDTLHKTHKWLSDKEIIKLFKTN